MNCQPSDGDTEIIINNRKRTHLMLSELEPPEPDSASVIVVDSGHACLLLAIAQIDNGPAHELTVEVYCEFHALEVVFETVAQVQLDRKSGTVDRFDEGARSLVSTLTFFDVLELLESMSVDGNRHRR
jgi:hypothetical protein